ncbi:hypothetical protein CFN78_02220 [Amycolatopsis antarctica]|uniref:TIR domain-containing protein n=1 Tax=Amycolatopsis antarctica TaxID=1854586 RepID=A0A263D937_9PSEU|nr:toll/interleukin-1 receptor domain-containing protein [Amycolatopsis antarctica]OZM75024.1 hypothetical protein CFN78_02220 [Amycolatopsis antarctica]
MPKIFINYRTGDAQDLATVLERDLRDRFGKELVFLDHRSIRVGHDFEMELRRGVMRSDALLAVIGPTWFTMPGENGKPKIGNPKDWVHQELRLALDNGIPVIPVIHEDAKGMLRADRLPPPLKKLANQQYREYQHRQADSCLDRIARDLVSLIPQLIDRRADKAGQATEPVRPPAEDLGPLAGTGTIITGSGQYVVGPQYNGPANTGSGIFNNPTTTFGGSQYNGPANTGSGTFNNAHNINTGTDRRHEGTDSTGSGDDSR